MRLAKRIPLVEALDTQTKTLRLAADFVQRDEPVVDIKGGVLESLAIIGPVVCWNLRTK
jgi:hypothetical protein